MQGNLLTHKDQGVEEQATKPFHNPVIAVAHLLSNLLQIGNSTHHPDARYAVKSRRKSMKCFVTYMLQMIQTHAAFVGKNP